MILTTFLNGRTIRMIMDETLMHAWRWYRLVSESAAGEVRSLRCSVVNERIVARRLQISRSASSHPIAHAEVLGAQAERMRKATYRLTDAVVYVTVPPCSTCVGALVHVRFREVVERDACSPRSPPRWLGGARSPAPRSESSFRSYCGRR